MMRAPRGAAKVGLRTRRNVRALLATAPVLSPEVLIVSYRLDTTRGFQ